jgi:hypothetical protein
MGERYRVGSHRTCCAIHSPYCRVVLRDVFQLADLKGAVQVGVARYNFTRDRGSLPCRVSITRVSLQIIHNLGAGQSWRIIRCPFRELLTGDQNRKLALGRCGVQHPATLDCRNRLGSLVRMGTDLDGSAFVIMVQAAPSGISTTLSSQSGCSPRPSWGVFIQILPESLVLTKCDTSSFFRDRRSSPIPLREG